MVRKAEHSKHQRERNGPGARAPARGQSTTDLTGHVPDINGKPLKRPSGVGWEWGRTQAHCHPKTSLGLASERLEKMLGSSLSER